MKRSLYYYSALIVSIFLCISSIQASGQCTATISSSSTVICAGSIGMYATFSGSNYKWYKNGTLMSGQTASSITLAVGSGSASYYCTATISGCSGTRTSNTIAITDNAPVASISPNGALLICPTSSGVLMTAQSGTGYSFQWIKNGTDIGGQTGSTYTAPTPGTYTCRVTKAGCPKTSNALTITDPGYTIPVVSASGNICNGGSVSLSATSLPSGSYYSWYKDGSSLGGGSSYAPYTATTPGAYKLFVVVSGCQIYSNTVTVANVPPTASISGNASICPGQPSTLLTAQTGNGYSYQWYRDGTSIGGANASTHAASVAGAYYSVVTFAGCSTTSNTINVSFANHNTTVVITGNTCDGNTATLTAAAGASYYVWYRNGNYVTGGSSNVLNVTTPGNYYLTFVYGPCSSNSTTVTVIGGTTPAISLAANGATSLCNGNSVQLSATSYSGASYQWFQNGVQFSSSSSPTIDVSEAGDYTVKVTDNTGGGCFNTSNSVAITTGQSPTSSITGSSFFCEGSSTTLTALSGTNYAFQWIKNDTIIIGATNSTFVVNTPGSYIVQTSVNGCSAISSTHTVEKRTVPISISGANEFCHGNSVLLTASNGGGYTYQWFKDNIIIDGATNPTYTSSSAGSFKVQATANGCQKISAPKEITELPLPVASIQTPSSTIVCQGIAINLQATTGTGNTYQWTKNGETIVNATNSSYSVTSAGIYRIVVTNGVCQSVSDSLSITKRQLPYLPIEGKKYFCNDANTTLNIAPLEGYSYQWLKNNQPIAGVTGNFIVVDESANIRIVMNDGSCTDTTAVAIVTELTIPNSISGIDGDSSAWTDERIFYQVIDTTNAEAFVWHVPNAVSVIYSDVAQRKVQLAFPVPGNHLIKIYSLNGGCMSNAFEKIIKVRGEATAGSRIPEAVKVSRDYKLPTAEPSIPKLLEDIIEDQSEPVFEGCLGGKYYVGFQLQYDLGDQQTTHDWSAFLRVSLIHNDDTLWTKPLQVDMTSQTFLSTIFHDSAISCTEDYRFVVRDMDLFGNVPESNIYLHTLLFKQQENDFNPSDSLVLDCAFIEHGESTRLDWHYSNDDGRKRPKEFDLEWVFINKHESFTGSTGRDAFAFKEGVGVTIAEFGYKHLIYYPDGKLWYRVRAVGYNPQHPEHRILGEWFYSPCDMDSVKNHEPTRNWQEQTVFAEEGKYKKVMSYFDGSLRQRQAQTNLSTEQVTVVGETLYDFEGRQSLNVLAVPATNASLKYDSGFNKFVATDTIVTHRTSATSKKFHYDNYRIQNSIASTSSGAGQYYSPLNASSSIHRDYIPDAEGYVFSQTEYLNDGTGRVSRQSGVGKTFEMDGDHATRYYYGEAAPAELIRLFGNNVGNAAHYKKNLVVDANGQVSVTYVDQEGRTIATALAGDPPANVDTLQSFKDLVPFHPVTVDVSSKNTKSKGLSSVSHKILNEAPNTLYAFEYGLKAYASEVSVFGCKTCLFDLTFTISDPDGKLIKLDTINNITAASCSDPTVVNDVAFNVLFEEIGDYTITKTLTVQELSFEQMESDVRQQASVQNAFSLIRNSYSVDPADCEICTTGPQAEAAIEEAINEIAALDCENIYNQIVQYYQDLNGTTDSVYVVPQELIEQHPLYCKYLLCTKDKESDIFEKRFARIKSWSEAVSKGYSNLFALDPFFQTPNLSGYNHKATMQGNLNDVFVARVGFDTNGDLIEDGFTEYKGPIAQVTDPTNTAYFVNENGAHDVNGKHLLYLDLLSRKDQLGQEAFQQQLGEHRWSMYKGYYMEAKRKLKLSIYDCASAEEELGINDDLPLTPETITSWGEEHGVGDSVSVAEIKSSLMSISNTCGAIFSSQDSTTISNHLEKYFNSNRKNFLKLIFTTDIGGNIELVAIQNILNNYGCNLSNVAQSDPLSCANEITVVLPKKILPVVSLNQEGGEMLFRQPTEKMTTESSLEELSPQQLSLNERIDSARYNRYKEIESRLLLEHKGTSVSDLFEKSIEDSQSHKLKNQRSSLNVSLQSAPLPDSAEYAALMKFYASTGGPSWYRRNGWKDADPNVIQSVEGWSGVYIFDDGHVGVISLPNNNMTGSIPNEFGNITKLIRIDLSNNKITGPLPSSVGLLTDLDELNLNRNRLSGAIPPSIGKLTNLTYLNLELNYLTVLPDSIWNLKNLWYLNLRANNNLVGTISSKIGEFADLEFLMANVTKLKDTIPDEINNLHKLTYLGLQGNQLTGQIPANLEGLTSIMDIDLGFNQLSGDIPASIGSLSTLETLYLGTNQLSGNLPPSMGQLSNLSYLNLSVNNLTGTVPTEFADMSSIADLDLSYNNFRGSLPRGLGELSNLIGGLAISKNQFTFSDILNVDNLQLFPGSSWYTPQDSVDTRRNVIGVVGKEITLKIIVDRGTTPASSYEWFRIKNGSTTNVSSPSVEGHTLKFIPSENDNGAKYYCKITNSGVPGLTLTSRIQNLTLVEGDLYNVCLEYDSTNLTIQKFSYKVDWNKEIAICLANEAKTDSLLVEFAIEKLVEDYVTEYYNKYNTKCLDGVKENLKYTYTSKEHHYTLYYYDQAKNLVQTVPPAGVKPLNATQVEAFMAGHKTEPAHMLVTRYQYSAVNQLLWQKTPDAGESNFFYNDKSQLKLSQNAQQFKDSKYSYTKYDEQGRATEVGEMETALTIGVLKDSLEYHSFPDVKSGQILADRTLTHYDFANEIIQPEFTQQYLRTRVSWVEVIDKNAIDTVATFYTYDIHGNVKSLLQQIPGLDSKRTDYLYDLVSGKMNYVFYQYNKEDQFSHKFIYDSDNRIEEVFTSTDRFVWNKEAGYEYYQHGPLARVELGAFRSQGIDYYYTLQGWIKGVNMPYSNDPGEDGKNDSRVGKDAFAYTLGYFDGDYKPLNNSLTLSDSRDNTWTRLQENMNHTGLHNGNISWMITDLAKIGEVNHDRKKGMQAMLYKYDQLHRITKSRSLTNYSEQNGFAARTGNVGPYDETYIYDGNGNILTLDRMNEQGALMDDFDYYYYKGTNKLRGVLPIVRDTLYNAAIYSNNKLYRDITVSGTARPQMGEPSELRATENIYVENNFEAEEGSALAAYIPEDGPFVYDDIGNLIADQEKGSKIVWTPYGKVRTVKMNNDSVVIKFRYDATGNRIEKRVEKNDTTLLTRYVRDATGNVMGIYNDTTISERPIYGSSRLGMYKNGVLEGNQTLGKRSYELDNHLGNVLTVVTDNIGMNSSDSAWANVVNVRDYYPFGLEMQGRHWSDTTSSEFRYRFNGKELMSDINGTNEIVDFGDRMFDTRLARWNKVDAKRSSYPGLSPYHFGFNNPIVTIDPDGKENIVIVGTEEHYKNPANKMMFAAQAIRQIKKYASSEPDEKTTILLATSGYSSKQIAQIRASAKKYGVEVVEVASAKQIINYINSQCEESSGVTDARNHDPVTNVDFFAHGKVGQIAIGLDGPKQTEYQISPSVLSGLSECAFSQNALISSFACRTGLGNTNINEFTYPWEDFERSKSIAQEIANKGHVKVNAYISRSDYSGTFGSSDDRALLKAASVGYYPGAEVAKLVKDFTNYLNGLIRNSDGSIWHPEGAYHPVQGGSTPKGTPNDIKTYTPNE
jgi:RHS repeat-associated protein